MSYKLVVLDLDGTALRSDGQVSPRTRTAVRAARNAGLLVIAATGRRLRHALPATHSLGLDCPGIFCNGALAVDLSNWRVLLYAPLRSVGSALVRRWQEAGLSPLVCRHSLHGPDLLYHTPSPVTPGWLLLDEGNGRLGWEADLAAAADGAVKLMAVDRLEWLRSEAAVSGLPVQSMLSTEADGSALLEVWREDISKATAVRELAQRAGIRRQEIVAFGDGYNDVELLAYAGLGVAMDNAVPEARAAARIVCGSNDTDGVAVMLESLVCSTRLPLRGL